MISMKKIVTNQNNSNIWCFKCKNDLKGFFLPFLGLLAFLEIVLKFIARIYRFTVIGPANFFYRFIVIGPPENLSMPTSANTWCLYTKNGEHYGPQISGVLPHCKRKRNWRRRRGGSL